MLFENISNNSFISLVLTCSSCSLKIALSAFSISENLSKVVLYLSSDILAKSERYDLIRSADAEFLSSISNLFATLTKSLSKLSLFAEFARFISLNDSKIKSIS